MSQLSGPSRRTSKTQNRVSLVLDESSTLKGFELKEIKGNLTASDYDQTIKTGKWRRSSLEHGDEKEGYGLISAIINIICCQVGVGMLTLPNATAKAGWIGAALCLTLSGLINTFTMVMLSKCLKSLRANNKLGADLTYPAIGRAAAGKPGYYLSVAAQYGMGICAGILFIAITPSQMEQITKKFPKGVWCTIFVAIQVPMTVFKNLKHVAPVAIFGALSSMIIMVCVVIQAIVEYKTRNSFELSKGEPHPFVPATSSDRRMIAKELKDMISSFVMFVFGFGSAIIFPELSGHMKNPDDDAKASCIANLICCFMYAPLCAVCYYVYGGKGLLGNATITEAFMTVPLNKIMVSLLVGHLVAAFPLLMNPAFCAIEERFKIDSKKNASKLRFILRNSIIGTMFLIAVIFVDLIVPLMSIISATFLTLASFICPCWFFLSIFGREHWHHGGIRGKCLVVLNIVTIITTTCVGAYACYEAVLAVLQVSNVNLFSGAWKVPE